MLQFDSIGEIPKDFAGSAVTIGKFDALHLGHQFLLHELQELAEQHALQSVVVTFDRHPLDTLKPGQAPGSIVGNLQKRFHLAEAGVDTLVTLQFDEKLASLSAEQFVEEILVAKLNASNKPKSVLVLICNNRLILSCCMDS